jgi:uncharacterized delta-60 repeat protein
MPRLFTAALAALLLFPAAALAAPGDPDRRFGQRGSVTLNATDADAVGGAVRVIPGNRVLAGGSAGGQFVVVKLRSTGSLDRSFGAGGQVVPALPGTSQEGVRAIATFRDGRIVAAGTLTLANGTTRLAAIRLLPTGEVDPGFGAGLGYVLVGPTGARLADMIMDPAGNIILAGGRPAAGGGAEVPIVIRLLPDGTVDQTFAAGGTLDGAALGLAGRATSLLARAEGTLTFSTGAAPSHAGPATFTVGRVLANGAPDPTFGGTGFVVVPLAAGVGNGLGAAVVRRGPGTTTLVAGTDLTDGGTPRGTVIRLRVDGSLDPRFGRRGVARVSRAGLAIRITSMVRDSNRRILLAGVGRLPGSLVARLRPSGTRDRSFGTGGLTYPRLGRPPGGSPIYTTIEAIDAAGSRAVLAGSAAGPGALVRGAGGTFYGGRFALTVSRLQ